MWRLALVIAAILSLSSALSAFGASGLRRAGARTGCISTQNSAGFNRGEYLRNTLRGTPCEGRLEGAGRKGCWSSGRGGKSLYQVLTPPQGTPPVTVWA